MPTRLDEIASENGLPAGYLVQILIELKSHQIVRSIRGKEGGYQLSRSPAEISLADVLRCMHGPLFESPAMADPRCAPELRDGWRQLQAGVDAEAGKINFQQMLDSGGDRGRMFYI